MASQMELCSIAQRRCPGRCRGRTTPQSMTSCAGRRGGRQHKWGLIQVSLAPLTADRAMELRSIHDGATSVK
jgi:hypothetical protein